MGDSEKQFTCRQESLGQAISWDNLLKWQTRQCAGQWSMDSHKETETAILAIFLLIIF